VTRGAPSVSLRRIAVALQLALLTQARAYFLHVYAGVTLLTVLGLRFLAPPELLPLLVPMFLLAEPGLLGVTLAAAQRYLERIEGSETALRVTPLQPREYLAAMVGASTLVGTLAGVAAWVGIYGPDATAFGLIPPLLGCTFISGLLGIALSLRYADFSRFILGMVPFVVLFQAPLLAHFGVVPWAAVLWIPSGPALLAFASLRSDPSPALLLTTNAVLLAACAAGFWLVSRRHAAAPASAISSGAA